ncbi:MULTISPECIES: DUF5961 family protein [unclassified Brevundimonas]|uniref:DUF5961 family protein n=1 Tax=unclassified Brevundimonas TaxID=2622653 RepID=UPI0025BF5B71|nr:MULTISPECIES: DUF5961 family protein [unclassified Brevundimonas]
MTPASTQSFYAYADAVGRSHGHTVSAESFEAAAVAYVEAWSPPVDGDNHVRIFVIDPADGVEHCFTLDFDQGGAPEPCD